MELIMLGTGNAAVTEIYNTCFAIRQGRDCLLVDAGGGNTVLSRLKEAGIALGDVKDIIVTHKHIDHLLGVIWLLRIISQEILKGKRSEPLQVYAHDEVIFLLQDICTKLLTSKQSAVLGNEIKLICVEDGEERTIQGRVIRFFDLNSTKAKQFGFTMALEDGGRLCCSGDEPLRAENEHYALGCDWLLHEAFCLASEADIYKPYEKSHTAVKDACETAQRLGVKNLVLYHTEDSRPQERRRLYTQEGAKYYKGNLLVPDDMEVIKI